MASKNTSNQTCENENDNQWPRFLIMEAADENVPLNLNAFVLKKAIDGMANAELDNVKPMKSGRVFIEVETRQQCKNLLKTTKLLGYLPPKVLLLCRSWGACVPRRSQRLYQLEF